MKIKKIETKNFGLNGSQVIEPGLINVIVGPTGSGKTTTLDTIRYAVTGELPSEPIKNGMSEMETSCDLADGTKVYRKLQKCPTGNKTTFKMNGKTTTQKSYFEYLEATTGIKPDSFDVITSSKVIGDMDTIKFTEFMMSFVPFKIDLDKCKSLVSLSNEQYDALSNLLPAPPVTFGIKEVEDALAFFEDSRKIVKRDIKTTEALAVYRGVVPTRTVKEIDDELAEILKKEGAFKSSQDALRNYERIMEMKSNIEKNIENANKEVASMSVKKPNADVKANLQAEQKKLEEDILSVNNTIRTMDDNAILLRNTLENLDKTVCPISEKLICNTDKTKVKSELSDLLQRTEEEINKQKDTLDKLKKQKEDVINKINDFINSESLYQKKVMLINKIEELKKTIPVIPPKPEVIKIDAEAIALAKRTLNEERNNLTAYQSAKNAESKLVVFKKNLELYESLCALLKPKGELYKKILEYAITPLETHINTRAKELRVNFAVKFDCENGINVMCMPRAGMGYIPMSKCSAGEQILLTFLVMDLVNVLTGSKILILDNLDRLDSETFESLIKLIDKKEVRDSYDHIFLSMINHSDTEDLIRKYDKKIDNIIVR